MRSHCNWTCGCWRPIINTRFKVKPVQFTCCCCCLLLLLLCGGGVVVGSRLSDSACTTTGANGFRQHSRRGQPQHSSDQPTNQPTKCGLVVHSCERACVRACERASVCSLRPFVGAAVIRSRRYVDSLGWQSPPTKPKRDQHFVSTKKEDDKIKQRVLCGANKQLTARMPWQRWWLYCEHVTLGFGCRW